MTATRSARRLTIRRAGPDGEVVLLRVTGSGDDWTAWSPPGEAGKPVDAREVRALIVAATGGLEQHAHTDAPPLVLQANELRELAAGALEHEHSVSVPDSVRPLLAGLRGVVDAEVTGPDEARLEAVSWLDGGPTGCWIAEPADDDRVVLAPGTGDRIAARLTEALGL